MTTTISIPRTTKKKKIIDKDEILAIKDLASESVKEILDDLGIETIDRGSYFSSPCPIHSGNKQGGFTITKCGIWKCWTGQCHVKWSSDLIGLVRAIKKLGFSEAYEYLVNLLKVDIDKLEEVKERVSNKSFVNKVIPKVEVSYYDEFDDSFTADTYLIKERGFSKEIVDFYGVKFCKDGQHKFWNRTTIPIRDSRGIVGFTGRLSVGEVKDYLPKWSNEGPLHNYLFNYENARKVMKESQFVIITEGALASMKLMEAGLTNSVSILGSDLSPQQLRLLLESEIYQVVICMDTDEAGKEATVKLMEKLKKFFYVINWDISPHKDLDEMSTEQIMESWEGIQECLK